MQDNMSDIVRKKRLSGIAALIMVVGLYILCRVTPYSSDDYVYSFLYDGVHYIDTSFSRLLSSPRDVLDSTVNGYRCINGRFVTHGFQFLMLYAGKSVWEVVNVSLFALLIFLMTRYARVGKDSDRFAVFTVIACLFWLTLPHPGQLFLWMAGSCNYLLPSVLVLSYLLCLLGRGRVVLASLPLGFLAGNSTEALSLGLTVCSVLYLCINREKMTLLRASALLCLVAGVLSNVLSPGLLYRMSEQGCGAGFIKYPVRLYIGVSKVLVSPFLIPSLLLFIFGIILSVKHRRRYGLRSLLLTIEPFLLLGALVCLLAAAYSTEINARSTYGFYFFSFLAVLRPCHALIDCQSRRRRQCCAGLLLVAATASIVCTYGQIKAGFLTEEDVIRRARSGENLICLEQCPSGDGGRAVCTSYILPNCLALHNRAIAAYYKTEPFALIRQKDKALIESVPKEIWDSTEPGDFRKVREGLMLTVLDQGVSACECAAYVLPNKQHTLLHRLRMEAQGWMLGGMSIIVFPRNGKMYCLIPGLFDEIRLKLYRGRKEQVIIIRDGKVFET